MTNKALPDARGRLQRIAPGLATLMNYRSGDLPHDIRAGVSVAAVALPVGVAYAQLAGFNPAVGLYASILPLVAYALFGTSRQLVVGPDAATCALVAAAVAPLAMGNDQLYLSLSMALAFLAGLFCIGASFLRLGALADFLSRPILVGFLNGISIHILLGQIGKIVGFNIDAVGIVPTAIELARSIGSTHWPTLLVGLSAFAIMAIAPRWLPKIPAALVAIVFAGIAVALFGLDAYGVKVVGKVPAGLPALHLPSFPPELLKDIVGAAAGIALVSFSSMMLTARSFASKNGYDIDADREFCALGVANMASAVSQGFAISGADSRTAMADASGGRTQVTGLVAAATVTLVLMFLTEHLAYVPVAALGAVLMQASFGLMNLPALREFWRLDRHEFGLSIIVTLGVVWVGAIQAIVLAVVLAVLRFVQIAARPLAEVLGEVPGHPGFHSLTRHPDAQVPPGLVLFRFNGPLVFFNAPYFKRSVFEALDRAGPGVKWFVIDMLPMPYTDITGMQTARELLAELKTRGIELVTAGRVGEMLELSQLKGISEAERLPIRRFSTLRKALQAFKAKQNQAATSPE